MVVAELGEDQRRAPLALARRARGGRRDPHEPGHVVGLVLDVLAKDHAAVEGSRRACAEGRPGRRLATDGADRLGARCGRAHLCARQLLAQEAGALGKDLRVGEHDLNAPGLQRRPRDEAVADGVVVLADDRHLVAVEGQRVEGRAHRPLDRVLERHEGEVGLAARDSLDRVVHGGGRDGIHLVLARRGEQRVLAERPGRAEVGDLQHRREVSSDGGTGGTTR